MVKFQDLIIGIDEYDTVLSTFAWDVISLDRSNSPIFTFSKLAAVNPVRLSATYGKVVLKNVPLASDGTIAVLGLDMATGKRYQPVANVAPIGAPCLFFLKPKTAQGSISSQATTGREVTKPTWTVSASEAIKAGLKIFGTGVESTTTGGVSRQSTINKNTQSQTSTTTTPVEVVQGLELHRTMHMPDIAMVTPANTGTYG